MANLNHRCHTVLEQLSLEDLRRELPHYPPETAAADAHGLDFSSNDYLQLSKHPEVIAAGVECAQLYGAGSTGSRLLSGNLPCFEALESQLAEFKCSEAALVFSSGYQANSSALAALLDKSLWGEDPLVFADRLNHASLHHACQLAGLRQIRFRHNDLQHLAELLDKHAAQAQPKVIVTETVFGMEGDQLRVGDLAELALRHHAMVYLDEAHATGVWGPEGRGLGATEHPAITALKAQGLWIVMGTFSKAVGVSGAYLACSTLVKQYVLNRCGGFVYSTAPSPFTIGAVSQSLRLIPGLSAQRAELHARADRLRGMLRESGWAFGHSDTHIVPIIAGEAQASMALKRGLQSLGIQSSAVRPPTVPPHTARVRIALNTSHSDADLHRLMDGLTHLKHT